MTLATEQRGVDGARDRGKPAMVAVSGRRDRSDEELARLGSAGVEALFARHHAGLYRFCLGFTRQGDDAADVMQTVWERAFVTFSRNGGRVANVRPWLYAVARNECLDAIRARGAIRTIDVSDVELAGGVSPEDSFEQHAELALLVDDLGELSERQRSALILRELAGFEGQQLASALGTSPPRALGLVAEARRRLIERRSGRGMPCVTAQHELTRMRRRSSGVQAHLDSCSGCQSFERSRRGRSLSSLAISPVLLAHGLAERLSALMPEAPQGIVKATAATALAVGSIGLMQSDSPRVHNGPQKGAVTSSAAKDQRTVSATHSATTVARVAAGAASGSTRPVTRPAAPRAGIKPHPSGASPPLQAAPTAPTTPAPTPAPTAGASPAAPAAPAAAGKAPAPVLPELTARIAATVDRTLVTTQQVTSSLKSTLHSAATLLGG